MHHETDLTLHILGGAGNASREHYLNNSSELSASLPHLLDIDAVALQEMELSQSLRSTVADVNDPLPLEITLPERDQHLALIATPMKELPLRNALEANVGSVIIDKPIANSREEVDRVEKLLEQHSTTRVCLLESYCVKSIPLFYLSGAISKADPRSDWIEQAGAEEVDTDLQGALLEKIGSIQKIKVSVLEGGDWGMPDLENIHYLMHNQNLGGMLLCLFPHAIHPLLASGLLEPESIQIESVKLYTLRYNEDDPSTFEHKWYPAGLMDIEAKAEVELRVQVHRKTIPISIVVGKRWGEHRENDWKTFIQGEHGEVDFCTMKGKTLKLHDFKRDEAFQLQLNDCPYRLSLREANLYLKGELPGDGNIKQGLEVVRLIERVKDFYRNSLSQTG